MENEIRNQAKKAAEEICEKASLKRGQILVVGCSSSEVIGDRIGSNSSVDIARAIFEGIYEVTKEKGIYLAAQCCEHLNRAIIIEEAAASSLEKVNVVPHLSCNLLQVLTFSIVNGKPFSKQAIVLCSAP